LYPTAHAVQAREPALSHTDNHLSDDAIVRARVQTFADAAPDRDRMDSIAVEAPLEVRIDGKPITVLMRTPGHDEELVRGFLFSEGIIAHADDIISLERPANLGDAERGNVIAVRLTASRAGFGMDRLFYSSSSCGVCGKKSIAALDVHGAVSESALRVKRYVLADLPGRLKAAQPTFAVTGGVHASGLFTADGQLVAVREDVGRHNALDKLIGWALAAGKVPLSDFMLLVSGRVSYELVQKAIVASLPLIAAVGAPSSLAIELAERFNITLVGFLRPDAMNVYAVAERVVG
jgi:FdhD protein